MAEIALYQLDAFTARVFGGNPAAVCPLDRWLPDETLQAIAAENNLSETAFFVAEDGAYRLRWFTPTVEIDLCGHATLASGALILDRLAPGLDKVRFQTRSGLLEVAKEAGLFILDFPARPAAPVAASPEVAQALGRAPRELLRGTRDYMAVFGNEDEVRALKPDMARLKALGAGGMIVTAPGREADFVSRFFAPAMGIDEDPVTGSAHCTLAPYWVQRLGRNPLNAHQVSSRGGELVCELRGDRVAMKGRVAYYLEGRIHI